MRALSVRKVRVCAISGEVLDTVELGVTIHTRSRVLLELLKILVHDLQCRLIVVLPEQELGFEKSDLEGDLSVVEGACRSKLFEVVIG